MILSAIRVFKWYGVVELLEVRAPLEVEGKEKYLYLQCGLGRENLIVASKHT